MEEREHITLNDNRRRTDRMTEIRTNKKIIQIIQIQFILYMAFLLKFVVFKYNLPDSISILSDWNLKSVMYHLSRANFEPLYTINNYMDKYRAEGVMSRNVFLNLVGNIIVFIPWGLYLPILFKKIKSLIGTLKGTLLFVIAIEVAQLITTLGSFDVDDIILNTLGAIIGYLIYKVGIMVMKVAKFVLLQFKKVSIVS
jgi:glycopeptide antibiotics resistance protein